MLSPKTNPYLRSLIVIFATAGSAATAHALIVVNGSFENGTFAKSGSANYLAFGGGYDGTLVLPTQSLISGWNVSFSPFDPDQTYSYLTASGPFGLEWAQGTVENQRWVDLNRGGDLWRVSQSFATVAGAIYQVSFDLLVGNTMGGATLRTQIDGVGSIIFDDTGTVEGFPRFDRFSHLFTATSNLSTIHLMAKTAGIDPSSGPQIDQVEIVAIPEPSAMLLTFLGSLMAIQRFWNPKMTQRK